MQLLSPLLFLFSHAALLELLATAAVAGVIASDLLLLPTEWLGVENALYRVGVESFEDVGHSVVCLSGWCVCRVEQWSNAFKIFLIQ